MPLLPLRNKTKVPLHSWPQRSFLYFAFVELFRMDLCSVLHLSHRGCPHCSWVMHEVPILDSGTALLACMWVTMVSFHIHIKVTRNCSPCLTGKASWTLRTEVTCEFTSPRHEVGELSDYWQEANGHSRWRLVEAYLDREEQALGQPQRVGAIDSRFWRWKLPCVGLG